MLKRWITVCNDERTCSRVRRRGRAEGSVIEGEVGGREGWRGDDVGCFVRAAGDEGTVVVGVTDAAIVVVSSPEGITNARIASSKLPRVVGDNESASESASPRRSSTS